MIRIRTLVAALVIALPVPVAVAGCGSCSSSNNEDPNQVLKETFNNATKISSGNMSIEPQRLGRGDPVGEPARDDRRARSRAMRAIPTRSPSSI